MKNVDDNELRREYERLKEENESLKGKLLHESNYDNLTELFNKEAFYAAVDVERAACGNRGFSITCFDVERFKLVNDLYGAMEGNALLQYIARELSLHIRREGEIMSRIGADVFALFTKRDHQGLEELALDIQKIFHNYPLDMELIPAIGVYTASEEDIPTRLMCDRAVLAANSAKGNYSRNFVVYSSRLRDGLVEVQEILNDTNRAFENGEFEVYIQPQCNTKTGKIIGGEALVRWRHPAKGFLPPNAFIPAFEKNGLIKRLDTYVWEEVAKWLRGWIDKGNEPVPISVNISRIDILEMDLFGVMEDIIKKYHIDQRLMELEITESAFVENDEEIVRTTDWLTKAGFVILIDDFGSGYSALSMLRDINAHVLKLDMRFLEKNDDKSKSIVESVLHLARWQDLWIIVEGVESAEQVKFLQDIGCRYAQGYYYYRPMPIKDFEAAISDPDNVEHQVGLFLKSSADEKLKFKDLFYEDIMSEHILSNLVGAAAIYQYDGRDLQMAKCNDEYYELMRQAELDAPSKVNLLDGMCREDKAKLREAFGRAKAAQGEECSSAQIRKILENGEQIWINVKLFYLRSRGIHDLYCAALMEITEQMEYLEELRMSEEMFRIAMDCSGDTIFELDIPTRVASYSPQSREKFGLEECVADAPEGFIRQNTVAKEYEESFRNIYRDIYGGKEFSSAVIKARLGDGSVVWNRVSLTAIKDRDGKNVKAVGLVKNVTEEIEMGIHMGKESQP